MLVNMTGKPDRWRQVDWVEEYNNLYTKVSVCEISYVLALT